MSLSAMIVDDDEFVRGALARQLAGFGATRVVTAADGHEAAKALLEQEPFDIILLDLMMPGSDGIQFLRRLAESRSSADLILTSSLDRKLLDTAESLARAHALQVLGVLPKPVRSQAIGELLARRGQRLMQRQSGTLITAQGLSSAMDAGCIVPHFQPKLCTKTGALRSVEALARWEHPTLGLIAPVRFIPVAEQFGSIDRLTMQISEQAFAALESWQNRGLRPDLEINLSARSLEQVDMPERVSELAFRHDVDPDRVTFEITESALIGHLSQSLDTLTRLRLKGFHLAVDDFGTGYSTMTQLKLLPLSELKVDQTFVSRATTDPEARAIVESCVGLAHQFGLVSVAEGVEDEATATFLRSLGTTLLQGYLYSRPLPADALWDWWLGHRRPQCAPLLRDDSHAAAGGEPHPC